MTNRDYRLHELTHQKFEELCSKICIRVLGEGFINFAQGRDGGRDGRFEGKANALPSESKPYEGKFIIQAKHTTHPCVSCSDTQFKSVITKEIPKIQRLNKNNELDYYLLLTNRKLTGEQESKIQQQLKTEVPQVSAIIIWGKERVQSFLDDNRDLHEEFGFNRPRSPLNIYPEDLQQVIEEFRKQIPQDLSKKNIKKESFIYLPTVEKNKVNGLSDNYNEYIQEESEKYFRYLIDFLKNPRNKKYTDLYQDTAFDFKGVIISRRKDYDTFDEVLEEVFAESYSKLKDKGINKKLLKVFIHLMYLNCDIGEKEHLQND